MRTWFLAPVILLAPLAAGQAIDQNPTVNYTTPAVRAVIAIQGLGGAVQKKLRVDAPMADQPLILRLHSASFQSTLEWIADVLHGTWVDENGWKTLRRTTSINMVMRNSLARERAKRFFDLSQRRLVGHNRSVLNKETATQTLLALQNPSGPGYAKARVNSADQRLIDRALMGVNPNDVSGGGRGGRWVVSDRPKQLQGAIHLADEERAAIFAEQNLWTTVLNGLSASHPELASAAKARRIIDPKNARIVLIFSRAIDGVPTHVEALVVDSAGKQYIRAADMVADPPESFNPPPTDWSKLNVGPVTLEPASHDYISALSGTASISDSLRSSLLQPVSTDPLRYGVSDGLLSIAEQKSWNLVASPPDAAIDAGVLRAITGDGASLLAALEPSCDISIANTVMLVKPRDPARAETVRTNRKALQEYLASLSRVGYSGFGAETDFLGASGPRTSLAIAQQWARLLQPSSLPFAGSPEALAFYGLLSIDQRKSLLSGYPLTLEDLTDTQKGLLGPLLMSRSGLLVFNGKPAVREGINTEITEWVQSIPPKDMEITLRSSNEPMVRIVGVDAMGAALDRIVRLTDAKTVLANGGPWQSVSFSTGEANLRRLVVKLSDQTQLVHLMPEFPKGMSTLGPIESLSADYRKAMGTLEPNLSGKQ